MMDNVAHFLVVGVCCLFPFFFSSFLVCCLFPFLLFPSSSEELDALQRELDVDDGNLAEAERRVAAAMAAVTALTESIRAAKAEHKSAVREVRVLAAHQVQLDDDIAARSSDIDTHDSRLQSRLVALKQDVTQLEVAIVASADQSKQIQEETVTLKQKVRTDTTRAARCVVDGRDLLLALLRADTRSRVALGFVLFCFVLFVLFVC